MEIPLPFSASRGAMLPTIVTSRPSRIHTVPRPITIVQCQRDHGSRSSRAGTEVSIVFVSVVVAALMREPPFHAEQYPVLRTHKRVGRVATSGDHVARVVPQSDWRYMIAGVSGPRPEPVAGARRRGRAPARPPRRRRPPRR